MMKGKKGITQLLPLLGNPIFLLITAVVILLIIFGAGLIMKLLFANLLMLMGFILIIAVLAAFVLQRPIDLNIAFVLIIVGVLLIVLPGLGFFRNVSLAVIK